MAPDSFNTASQASCDFRPRIIAADKLTVARALISRARIDLQDRTEEWRVG